MAPYCCGALSEQEQLWKGGGRAPFEWQCLRKENHMVFGWLNCGSQETNPQIYWSWHT